MVSLHFGAQSVAPKITQIDIGKKLMCSSRARLKEKQPKLSCSGGSSCLMRFIKQKMKQKQHSKTCILLSCVYLAPNRNRSVKARWSTIQIGTFAFTQTFTRTYTTKNKASAAPHNSTLTHLHTQTHSVHPFIMYDWHLLPQMWNWHFDWAQTHMYGPADLGDCDAWCCCANWMTRIH